MSFLKANNLFNVIKKSCEQNNNTSSTRIIAYIITILIIIMVLLSLGAGIYIAISTKQIPNEIVIILGMLLAHQLTLLGFNKHYETKQKIAGVPEPSQEENIENNETTN